MAVIQQDCPSVMIVLRNQGPTQPQASKFSVFRAHINFLKTKPIACSHVQLPHDASNRRIDYVIGLVLVCRLLCREEASVLSQPPCSCDCGCLSQLASHKESSFRHFAAVNVVRYFRHLAFFSSRISSAAAKNSLRLTVTRQRSTDPSTIQRSVFYLHRQSIASQSDAMSILFALRSCYIYTCIEQRHALTRSELIVFRKNRGKRVPTVL